MKKYKKTTISISLETEIIDYINSNYKNRSKFISNAIIEQMSLDKEFENELKNKMFIL